MFVRRRTFYVRFDDRESSITEFRTGRSFQGASVVAVEAHGDGRVVAAVGDEALGRRECELVWPFSHERMVLADFEVAQILLRHLILQVAPRTMWKPRIILHPLRRFSTDLTDVEIRALLELALSEGASWAAVYVGAELTAEAVATTPFPWSTSGRSSRSA